jgi:DNA-binding beta-propeller fold protein YncE
VKRSVYILVCTALAVCCFPALASTYVNLESSHVHPIDLTPSGARLLAVNTPDALLEVFTVEPGGSLTHEASIPTGLEPVTVVARTDGEAWVVNNLSDTVSIVDLDLGATVEQLQVGDEPTDVVFAGGKAFVAVSTEDAVKVYDLGNLDAPPTVVDLFGRDVRALAVSNNGSRVYAVVLKSGNRTTVAGILQTFPNENGLKLNASRLAALDLRDLECDGPTPSYPPLPDGIVRNPALTDPVDGIPKVALIVAWDEPSGQWRDETGADWTHCLPYSLADKDLFVIQVGSLTVSEVRHLGTSLLDVSVHPTNDRVYVPNTEARNFVRFEHPLGVQGHVVDNRFAVVDPASGNAVTHVDLNTHIDRASNPATNLAEREASISQPGMMVWKSDGSVGFLTAIGSRKIFRVDGGCTSGACIFGGSRGAPDVVEVGEGPTGVALLEAGRPEDERLYVLNRISHSISIVRPDTLVELDEIPLHDPSSENTKLGRRFLYDGIDSSGHGDGACSSCHLFGDMDGLAWDLGNPEGEFVAYSEPFDNVRFIGGPSHAGFDPQKGPMTTQTLRAMLEPLHWRGDRPTFNDFNPAFVGLMGTEDIGPVNGHEAGLTAQDMELFRQFALEIRFPPNPFRNVDDTMPCGTRAQDPGCEVNVPGSLFPGNPTEGELLFNTHPSDGGAPCTICHTHPFGAAGGQLGGVEPAEPTSIGAAALFSGNPDGSPHSDLKVAHTRNMYEKIGPVLADPGDDGLPETKSGFGYIHDGSFPDLHRFFSVGVFNLSAANQAQQVRDMTSFMFHFPTLLKPSVGAQVTLPQGTPPLGGDDEARLSELVALGDLGDGDRHCDLTAATIADGRLRRYHLDGGNWTTDVAAEAQITTTALRENAAAPITFTCGTIGSGERLGGDRDEDGLRDGDDCAPGDPANLAPGQVADLLLSHQAGTTGLSWNAQTAAGPSVRYDLLGGDLSALPTSGLTATSCVASEIEGTTHDDLQAAPASGNGYYYLIRAGNPCGGGELGPGREALESLACP